MNTTANHFGEWTSFSYLERGAYLKQAVSIVAESSLWSWAACLVAILGFVATIVALRKVRGTTLSAPCQWAALSALCLATYAAFEALREEGGASISVSAFLFAATTATFCPIVSVLGAKRPQDRGWQWVVLTLWLIIVWPAAEAVAFPAGRHLELSTLWKLFVLGLILLGLMNYLPTRFWGPAVLIGMGQLLLMSEFIPAIRFLTSQESLLWGNSLLALGAFVASRGIEPRQVSPDSLEQFQSQWLWFRDTYGSFWALRILQRVNQTAEARDWPIRLSWSGFERSVPPEAGIDEKQLVDEVDLCLNTLLRRFL